MSAGRLLDSFVGTCPFVGERALQLCAASCPRAHCTGKDKVASGAVVADKVVEVPRICGAPVHGSGQCGYVLVKSACPRHGRQQAQTQAQ